MNISFSIELQDELIFCQVHCLNFKLIKIETFIYLQMNYQKIFFECILTIQHWLIII